MGCGIHIFKKPRGIISVLKFVTALAAACTTLAFSTKIKFNIPCNGELDKTVYISVSHPYKMLKFEDSDNDRRNLKCDNDEKLRMMRSIKLPFDYARTASFFATCAIASMSFTFAILFVSMLVDPEADNLKKGLVILIYILVTVSTIEKGIKIASVVPVEKGSMSAILERMLKFEDSGKDRWNLKCDNDEELRMMRSIKLPFDYARTASFFATYALTSMGFTFALLFVSMIADPKADNLKEVLEIDFGITAVAALLWLALSSAWAQGAFDLMHYLHPETLFNFLSICITDGPGHFPKCQIVENATYDVLYASVVLGFVNVLLWLCNLWFIYKEIISCPPSETKTDKEKNANSEEVGKYKHTKRSSDDAVDNDPRKYDTRGAAVHAAAVIAVMAEFLK